MEHFRSSDTLFVLLALLTLPAASARARDTSPAAPSNREVLARVFELSSLRLSQAAHCTNAGPSQKKDATIGDYLAVFWEAHLDTCGKNRISVTTKPIPALKSVAILEKYGYALCAGDSAQRLPECKEDLWLVDFEICRHCDRNNDRWCWGIRFLMRQSDRSVVPGSVWCTGGG